MFVTPLLGENEARVAQFRGLSKMTLSSYRHLKGRAVASTHGENLGFIDFTGGFVVPPRFSRCNGSSEGLAADCMDTAGDTSIGPGHLRNVPNRVPALDGKLHW